MVRPLIRAARALSVILSVAALTGCGAIAPGAALHADAEIEAASPAEALAATASASQDEPVPPVRLPSDVAGDAYCGPSQVIPASAEEPVAGESPVRPASFESEDGGAEPAGATAGTGTVQMVGPAEFEAAVLAANVPVLVDFSARWCKPCQQFAPLLDELAEDRPDVKIVTVDIDQSPQLAAAYHVRSVPTLLVFRQGELSAQHKGTATRAQLNQLLQR